MSITKQRRRFALEVYVLGLVDAEGKLWLLVSRRPVRRVEHTFLLQRFRRAGCDDRGRKAFRSYAETFLAVDLQLVRREDFAANPRAYLGERNANVLVPAEFAESLHRSISAA